MKNHIPRTLVPALLAAIFLMPEHAPAQQAKPSAEQLAHWLKKFPEADANGDGILTLDEATVYRKAAKSISPVKPQAFRSAPEMQFHHGWNNSEFPDYAVCYKSPEEIMAIYRAAPQARSAPVPPDAPMSFPKPIDGGLRIVGVGHSFMAPAYKTLPLICKAAGFEQLMCLHTGGGVTGSARYKWEQENGIFEFNHQPQPKLLAAIANADWEAMLWGGYYCDRPEFYTCWINFCTRYHPDMKFYLADAWPQLGQIEILFGKTELPKSEDFFTEKVLDRMGQAIRDGETELIRAIQNQSSQNVFILPTSDALTEIAKLYCRGELPGVEGIHRLIGGKERSIWRDQTGHLGTGFDRLEGYVFFATLYGRSPEQIKQSISFDGDPNYPSEDLDRIFRKVAWQAVINNPLSGIKDANRNGIGDHLEPQQ